MLDLTPAQINALYQNGHINDATYQQMIAQNQSVLPPTQNNLAPGSFNPQSGPNMSPLPPGTGMILNPSLPVQAPPTANRPWSGAWPFNSNGNINSADYEAALRAKAALNPSGGENSRLPLSSDPTISTTMPTYSSSSPFDPGFDKQIEGVQNAANANSDKTNSQAKLMQQGIDEQSQLEQDRQTAEIQRQAQLRTKLQDLDNSSQQIAAMNIDPNRFWNDKNTAQQVGMGIALGLGAFGGSPDNRVASMLNAAVDRDISLQKWQIANARDNLSNQFNIFGQMRNIFGDDRLAEEATRTAALDKIKNQILQQAMQYSAPEVQANAQRLIGELDNQKVAARQSFINQVQFGGNPPQSFSEGLAFRKDQGERTIPGYGLVNDAREAPKVRDTLTSYDNLKSILAETRQIANKYTGPGGVLMSTITPTDTARALSLSSEAQQELNKMFDNGVMNEGDRPDYANMFPTDVTKLFSYNNQAKLDGFGKTLDRRLGNYLKNHGGLKAHTADKKRGE